MKAKCRRALRVIVGVDAGTVTGDGAMGAVRVRLLRVPNRVNLRRWLTKDLLAAKLKVLSLVKVRRVRTEAAGGVVAGAADAVAEMSRGLPGSRVRKMRRLKFQ